VAFEMRMTGGYVSSRKNRFRKNAAKPIIATSHSVQRHPRYDSTINPPMKGASKGPVKTVIEKTVIARPRVLLSNISEKTAATTAKGAAPKIPKKRTMLVKNSHKKLGNYVPPQNLQSRIVCRSFPAATAIWKIENPNIEITKGNLLPFNSLRGAQNTGPMANPRT
jgi:hypothetical protein